MVVTNVRNRWIGALDVLVGKQNEIDQAFANADLNALKWPERVTEGRWWIRYTVAASYEDQPDPEKMRELNKASALMKQVFEPLPQ